MTITPTRLAYVTEGLTVAGLDRAGIENVVVGVLERDDAWKAEHAPELDGWDAAVTGAAEAMWTAFWDMSPPHPLSKEPISTQTRYKRNAEVALRAALPHLSGPMDEVTLDQAIEVYSAAHTNCKSGKGWNACVRAGLTSVASFLSTTPAQQPQPASKGPVPDLRALAREAAAACLAGGPLERFLAAFAEGEL